jgi:CheY-like chemotaxis protein
MQGGALAHRLTHPDGSRPRVLYAEDQASSRIVTKAMLERMGLDVDAVEDGEVALDLASNGSYDIILLDIEMPVMDGVSAARGIRALGGDKSKTPILALSAFLADSTEVSAWRDAFDHAIPKPANGNELRRAIDKALNLQPAQGLVIETAKPGALSLGLQSTLPRHVWIRFVAMAAEEAVHYANAADAAFIADDAETLRRCLHSLKGLAANFGADAMSLHLQAMRPDAPKLKHLVSLARDWKALR